MLIMALDVGTSSARALCFDGGGRAVPGAEARVTYEPAVTPDGGSDLYERLAPLAAPGHAVIASGGTLTHSRSLTTITADALGVPMILASVPEASARGAALLCLEALGAPAPPPIALEQTFAPDPGRHDVYRAARERQQRLYDNVVGLPPLLRE